MAGFARDFLPRPAEIAAECGGADPIDRADQQRLGGQGGVGIEKPILDAGMTPEPCLRFLIGRDRPGVSGGAHISPRAES